MSGKRIGFSYWGYCENIDDCTVAQTPDGHRYGRPIFVNALVSAGHKVIALQEQREKIPFSNLTYDQGFPDIDILFVEWRWKTHKNSGPNHTEKDFDRQHELLTHYHGKIPVIIWDTDIKLTSKDELDWPDAKLADPMLKPNKISRVRYRIPFWTDSKAFFEVRDALPNFGYIGNNYERDEMFKKFYDIPAATLRELGVQTQVWGNWLQYSPERPSPKEIVTKYKNISFVDRLSFKESMQILNSFICTAHITKPIYASNGFVSPRIFEALACNVPALIPEECMHSYLFLKDWRVSSSADVVKVVDRLSKIDKHGREGIIIEQRYRIMSNVEFDVKNVVQFIESFL